jgi:pimeloyl-ACP methyl ester carboxylesterase
VETSDLFILIPGITGSVLRKDGRDVWALSGGALWTFLSSLGKGLEDLRLQGDDPELDDLGDGITAAEVILGVTLLPGLHKADSYKRLLDFLKDSGLASSSSLSTFPYDWRRDNRVAARKLGRLVEEGLGRLRRQGADRPRVVLIAHSMGGLVARYYLEVLGGWRHCRALVTFGTPHRGSVKILDYLANGYKKTFVDLTEIVRSCTSAYQLLPIYPAIEIGDDWERVGEISGLPHIAPEQAVAGRAFHQEIQDAQESNSRDPRYNKEGYALIPVVGTGQPTLQSARLHKGETEGRLISHKSLPPGFAPVLADGDGSVPRASAIPLEMSSSLGPLLYVAEQHGTLHAHEEIQQQVYENVRQAGIDLSKIRKVPAGERVQGLALSLDDAYGSSELVEVAVDAIGIGDKVRAVTAQVEAVTAPEPRRSVMMAPAGSGWAATLEGLPPGTYRVEVQARGAAGLILATVTDLFEVVPL